MKFGENLPPTTPSWFPQVRRAEPAPSWHPEAPQDAPVPSCPCPPLHLGDTIGTRLLCNTFFSWKGGPRPAPGGAGTTTQRTSGTGAGLLLCPSGDSPACRTWLCWP